jgi:tetratricopeptide (TPR) repeat protein
MNAHNKGDLNRAESFYQDGLAVAQRCNHQRILAGTTLFQGIIEYQRGNFSRAMDLYQQSREVAQRAGDLLLISLACENLGDLLVQQGSSEKARPLMERSLEINEKLQFRFGLAATWINFAEYYRHQGNYVQAEHCIEKSMSLARDLGLKERISYDLYLFGMLALHQNRYSSAAERFIEYFDFDRVYEERVSLCRFLTALSSVAAGTGDSERCARLFGAAQVAMDSFPDFRMDPFDRAEFDRHIQIARNQLSRTRFEALSKEGQTISMEQAIKLAAKTKID